MWYDELQNTVEYNPVEALRRVETARDVVEGLVPSAGVTWLFGPSMSFKSFVVVGMAAAVSQGRDWLGRAVEEAVVVYIGAEGGDALHVRRAAAEVACGGAGPLVVAQERPVLDKEAGALHLQGILRGVCSTFWGLEAFGRDAEAVYDTPARAEAWEELLAANKRYRQAKANGASPEALDAAREARDAARKASENADARARTAAGYADYARSVERYTHAPLAVPEPEHRRVLCVIDTFSQTAEDDTRHSVSAYIKNLRHVIEQGALDGFTLSFLVVDHVTKEGGTYLGSVAKLNDVDSQLEMARLRKSMLATITQTKNKNAPESDPVHIELKPFELEGFVDVGGRPLRTLVVAEGEAASELLARQPEGNAAMLLDLLRAHGGRAAAATVRREFREMRIEAGARRASADKAYLRSVETLQLKGIAVTDGEDIVLV